VKSAKAGCGHVTERAIEIDTPEAPAYIRFDRRKAGKMTKGTFGEYLKREREMRGVSLDEITAATRIATRFLQAIEDEHWDQLPGGVFNRGFVRSVARYLGLDEENTVAEYVSAVEERPTVPVWTGSPPAVRSEQPWLAWILLAVIVLVLAMGGWFAVRRIFAWRASRHAAQVSAQSTAPPSEKSALPRDSNSPPASGAISPAGATPFELKVEAGRTTRVTVESDAHRVFEGTMKAGEDRVFTAQDKIQLSAGDAGALLLELNGKTLAPIGPPGHEGQATLTRESLNGTAGGSN
jgi:cytoskeletal protein RodZ